MKQPSQVIDSHVHFWDRSRLEYRWLAEEQSHLAMDHLPAQLRAAGAELDGLVFIQADCRDDQGSDEASWVHELADQGVPVLAVVAHAPLETDAAARRLDELTTLPLVRGIRRLLQDEKAGFALDPRFVDGVRQLAAHDLTFDLCIREHQLRECLELTARVPEVTFILDHLGKPNVSAGDFGEWSVLIDELASRPNVRCKLSGLGNEAQPRVLECKSDDDFDKVVAEHNGYPVTHRRTVTFDKRERLWLIDDEFFGDGEHAYEARFHFAPGAEGLVISLLNHEVEPVL